MGLLLVVLPLLVNAAFLRSPPADKQVQLSAEKQKTAHYGCEKACKPSPVSESACITGCETEIYNCMDEGCIAKVLAHYKKTKGVHQDEKKDEKKKDEKGGDKKKGDKKEAKKEDKKKKASLIGDTPPVQFSAEDKKAAHFGCVNACESSPTGSNCITACETAHYQCADTICQAANLKHFQDTKGVEKKEEKKEEKGKKDAKKGDKKKDAKKEDKKKKAALIGAPETPLAASKPLQLSADDKKTAHFGCVKACTPGPVESKCVTACEAAHYQCIDVTCQEASLKHFQDTKGVEKKEAKKEEKKGEKGAKKEEKKGDAKKEEKKK